jgi:hypothetical protein
LSRPNPNYKRKIWIITRSLPATGKENKLPTPGRKNPVVNGLHALPLPGRGPLLHAREQKVKNPVRKNRIQLQGQPPPIEEMMMINPARNGLIQVHAPLQVHEALFLKKEMKMISRRNIRKDGMMMKDPESNASINLLRNGNLPQEKFV